jgi:hypothetical protein
LFLCAFAPLCLTNYLNLIITEDCLFKVILVYSVEKRHG